MSSRSDVAASGDAPSTPLADEARLGPGVALRFDRPGGEVQGVEAGAVLYLHGLGSSRDGEKAEFFRHRFLAAGTAFCSIDFRGHGRSADTNLGLTLSRNLEDARLACDWLRERGIAKVDLVGSSFGGLTALWLARLEPERIRRVAVIAPAVGIRAKVEGALGDELLARWRREGEIPYANEVGTTVIGYGFFEDLARYPDDELADGYAVPTLVFQGELDESVDATAVRAFAEACPGVELRTWPGGDHRLTDRLDEVWERTASFLRP